MDPRLCGEILRHLRADSDDTGYGLRGHLDVQRGSQEEAMGTPLLLTNVRPLGGPARDLLADNGRITRVGERLEAPEGALVVDGRGQLALPGLVDAHAHLDKTLWGLPWRPHTAGEGLGELIDNEHRGRAGKVTISHAFALAEIPGRRLERLVEGLADQRVSLTTVAPGNRPPLPLARLREAGVAVGLGCDGIGDLWSPWGDGDLLGRAALLAWRSGARRDQDLAAALELATTGGARVLGLDG